MSAKNGLKISAPLELLNVCSDYPDVHLAYSLESVYPGTASLVLMIEVCQKAL